MKKILWATLGVFALVSSAHAAGPYVPAAKPRPPVHLGTLVPVKDYVLYNKPVVDTKGNYLGWVENVKFTGTMITQVKMVYNGYARAAWLFVEYVQYDPKNKVIVTTLSKERIQKISFQN